MEQQNAVDRPGRYNEENKKQIFFQNKMEARIKARWRERHPIWRCQEGKNKILQNRQIGSFPLCQASICSGLPRDNPLEKNHGQEYKQRGKK